MLLEVSCIGEPLVAHLAAVLAYLLMNGLDVTVEVEGALEFLSALVAVLAAVRGRCSGRLPLPGCLAGILLLFVQLFVNDVHVSLEVMRKDKLHFTKLAKQLLPFVQGLGMLLHVKLQVVAPEKDLTTDRALRTSSVLLEDVVLQRLP